MTYREAHCSKGGGTTNVPSCGAYSCVLKCTLHPLQRKTERYSLLSPMQRATHQLKWLLLPQRGITSTLLPCYCVFPIQINVAGCHQIWKLCLSAWPEISKPNQVIPIVFTFIINTASSLTTIRQILQLANNLVDPAIFIIIHNLVTYTTLRTNHLKSDKNTIIMAKSPPKHPKNKSNQRTKWIVPRSFSNNHPIRRKQQKLNPPWISWTSRMETDTKEKQHQSLCTTLWIRRW